MTETIPWMNQVSCGYELLFRNRHPIPVRANTRKLSEEGSGTSETCVTLN
jgi:hypothetical protein